MNYKKLFFFAILSGLTLIAGCDDKKSSRETSAETSANLTEQNKKAQEILKYNAYVDVTNFQPYARLPFGEDIEDELAKQKQFMADLSKNKEPLDNYYNLRESPISGKIERLEKALAVNASLPDLDDTAAKYLQHLKTLQSLNNELSLYASSKEYLEDKGEFFKSKGPQLISQLEAVIKAQNEFEDKMTQHDNELVKEQFKSAPKDTVEYFRNGIIYYEKIIIYDFENQLNKFDSATLAKIDTNTATLAGLMKKYDNVKTVRSNTCTTNIAMFVASSRRMVKSMKDDEKHYFSRSDAYPEALQAKSPVYRKLAQSPAEKDFRNLMRHFSGLIDDMNANHC